MKTITVGQIDAVGDSVIDWVEEKAGTGWLATNILDPFMEKVRTQWDATGAADVGKLLSDLGWTVTP